MSVGLSRLRYQFMDFVMDPFLSCSISNPSNCIFPSIRTCPTSNRLFNRSVKARIALHEPPRREPCVTLAMRRLICPFELCLKNSCDSPNMRATAACSINQFSTVFCHFQPASAIPYGGFSNFHSSLHSPCHCCGYLTNIRRPIGPLCKKAPLTSAVPIRRPRNVTGDIRRRTTKSVTLDECFGCFFSIVVLIMPDNSCFRLSFSFLIGFDFVYDL